MSEYPSRVPGMRALFDEPVTTAAISEVEAKWNARLPEDYRAFLARWNGVYFIGLPIVSYIDKEHSPNHAVVKVLYGLCTEPSGEDLRYASNGYEFNERVPDHVIAIGENHWHERIAMSLGSEDYGYVYHWAPGVDWEEDENVQTYDYLLPLARSFSEFYDRIQRNPDPEYHDWPK